MKIEMHMALHVYSYTAVQSIVHVLKCAVEFVGSGLKTRLRNRGSSLTVSL